jgi:hypothetical protein
MMMLLLLSFVIFGSFIQRFVLLLDLKQSQRVFEMIEKNNFFFVAG